MGRPAAWLGHYITKMNEDKIKEKAEKAEQLFIEGDIFSPSISELTEHIQSLLSYNAQTDEAAFVVLRALRFLISGSHSRVQRRRPAPTLI